METKLHPPAPKPGKGGSIASATLHCAGRLPPLVGSESFLNAQMGMRC